MTNIIHIQEDICDYCGETVPKLEEESACAEFTPLGKLACWRCQNHNPVAQKDLYN